MPCARQTFFSHPTDFSNFFPLDLFQSLVLRFFLSPRKWQLLPSKFLPLVPTTPSSRYYPPSCPIGEHLYVDSFPPLSDVLSSSLFLIFLVKAVISVLGSAPVWAFSSSPNPFFFSHAVFFSCDHPNWSILAPPWSFCSFSLQIKTFSVDLPKHATAPLALFPGLPIVLRSLSQRPSMFPRTLWRRTHVASFNSLVLWSSLFSAWLCLLYLWFSNFVTSSPSTEWLHHFVFSFP